MKLSEAIRLGSLLRPQGYRKYASADGRTCALGAALEAIGIRPRFGEGQEGEEAMFKEAMSTPSFKEWATDLGGKNPPCPVCGDMEFRGRKSMHDGTPHKRNVSSVIIHLNNDHEWTRGEIADWVATFEAESAPVETRELVGAAT